MFTHGVSSEFSSPSEDLCDEGTQTLAAVVSLMCIIAHDLTACTTKPSRYEILISLHITPQDYKINVLRQNIVKLVLEKARTFLKSKRLFTSNKG